MNYTRGRRGRGPTGDGQFVVAEVSGSGDYNREPATNRNAVACTRVVITQKMEDEMLALNTEYLQSQDTGFRSIIDKASQAAVYSYNLTDGEGWSDAKAAGCLMLYERHTAPRIGFIILNRLAVPNWKHFFTPTQVELQVQGKYLLFKDGSQIFCLWFYEDKDPQKFGDLLKGMGSIYADEMD